MYVGRHYSIILHEGEAFETRNENYGFFLGGGGEQQVKGEGTHAPYFSLSFLTGGE